MPPPTTPYDGFNLEQTVAIWNQLNQMQTRFESDLSDAQDELHALDQQRINAQTLAQAQATKITRLQGQLAAYQAIQHAQPGPAAIEKKIIGVKDPGDFDGEPGNFAPWKSRMGLWLYANASALPTNFDKSSAILTRMKGKIPAKWAQYHIDLYKDGTEPWPTEKEMLRLISEAFLPSSTKDWARKKLLGLRMGERRVEEWLAEFFILKEQGKVEDGHAIDLLIKNMSNPIREELYRVGGQHESDLKKVYAAVRIIGIRIEEYNIAIGKRRVNYEPKPLTSTTNYRAPPYMGELMDIGATQASSSSGPRGGCFTCQGPHFARDCPQRKGGGQPQQQRRGESRPQQGATGFQARALYDPYTGQKIEQPQTAEAQNGSNATPLRWQAATKDMDFEAARAYFKDYESLNEQ
ncbi:hypothetical protein CONPUDRAFT_155807 [Coniophora puteana RWD-64-598 SS2]|uniref:Retrotransposon gag domain-containing protein n=1 Tax=Coniophora puteana (strain RWD-64-598) TaxID=741705 RepID=A0A5M3MJL4_CONPW|nr:uncharacterized protein CONPUDRAFT_155807 [Coniophora puteana RWD-64-598 SS2]EIW79120.1 hypothetical protein CONPUDRAFT_155807 [Coniophora puteana RWD-64-598 SS2]